MQLMISGDQSVRISGTTDGRDWSRVQCSISYYLAGHYDMILPFTSNVPHIQFESLRLYSFDIETLNQTDSVHSNQTNPSEARSGPSPVLARCVRCPRSPATSISLFYRRYQVPKGGSVVHSLLSPLVCECMKGGPGKTRQQDESHTLYSNNADFKSRYHSRFSLLIPSRPGRSTTYGNARVRDECCSAKSASEFAWLLSPFWVAGVSLSCVVWGPANQ